LEPFIRFIYQLLSVIFWVVTGSMLPSENSVNHNQRVRLTMRWIENVPLSRLPGAIGAVRIPYEDDSRALVFHRGKGSTRDEEQRLFVLPAQRYDSCHCLSWPADGFMRHPAERGAHALLHSFPKKYKDEQSMAQEPSSLVPAHRRSPTAHGFQFGDKS